MVCGGGSPQVRSVTIHVSCDLLVIDPLPLFFPPYAVQVRKSPEGAKRVDSGLHLEYSACVWGIVTLISDINVPPPPPWSLPP